MKYLLVLLIGAALLSCNNIPDVESQIVQKIQSSKNTSLPLRSIIDINWDKLYIIPPYATERSLTEDLLPYKDKIESTGINIRDDVHILYFLKNKKLVAEAMIDANKVYFYAIKLYDASGHLTYFTPDQELHLINSGDNYSVESIK